MHELMDGNRHSQQPSPMEITKFECATNAQHIRGPSLLHFRNRTFKDSRNMLHYLKEAFSHNEARIT